MSNFQLNYCADDDEEGNRVFSAAFDLFLRVVHGLKPRRIELKNVTVEQFDTLATKWTLRNVLLKQSKKNMELVQNKLINVSYAFLFQALKDVFRVLLVSTVISMTITHRQISSGLLFSIETCLPFYLGLETHSTGQISNIF